MHVQLLAISAIAVSDDGDNNELVLRDEVPNAPLVAVRRRTRVGLDVEFEGWHRWQREEDQQIAAQRQEGEHCDGELC